jgi:hypothetical protein
VLAETTNSAVANAAKATAEKGGIQTFPAFAAFGLQANERGGALQHPLLLKR